MFDALLHSATLSDDTLENLAYFGTTHALIALEPTPCETVAQCLRQIDQLLTHELPRVQRAGLQARCLIGVQHGCTPSRAHPELWRELTSYFDHPMCVGIGPLTVDPDSEDGWVTLHQQLQLGAHHTCPIVLQPPPQLAINNTYKMLQRAEAMKISSDRLIVIAPSPAILNVLARDNIKSIAAIHHDAWQHPVDLTEDQLKRTSMMLCTSLNHSVKHPILLPKWLARAQKTQWSRDIVEHIGLKHGLTRFFPTA